MTKSFFKYPKRVFINAPSELQPYHKYHGTSGIAVLVGDEVIFCFLKGDVVSMPINPMYLSLGSGAFV